VVYGWYEVGQQGFFWEGGVLGRQPKDVHYAKRNTHFPAATKGHLKAALSTCAGVYYYCGYILQVKKDFFLNLELRV
jgi:hypothetical protein